MKKRIIAISLVVAMLAIAVIGGSLAYFTDTDAATNTFTVGNVDIKLIEQQKGAEGLEPFDQEKNLVPGTSSNGSAVSKIVTVENTGSNPAYVWVEMRIPTALLDLGADGQYKPGTLESKNALHYNTYGYFMPNYHTSDYTKSPVADGILDADLNPTYANAVDPDDGLWNDFVIVGTDGDFTVLRSTMVKPLPAGMVSMPALRQLYMDWRVMRTASGDFTLPNGSTYPAAGSWNVTVTAYAIQAQGFADVNAAVAAYATNGTK